MCVLTLVLIRQLGRWQNCSAPAICGTKSLFFRVSPFIFQDDQFSENYISTVGVDFVRVPLVLCVSCCVSVFDVCCVVWLAGPHCGNGRQAREAANCEFSALSVYLLPLSLSHRCCLMVRVWCSGTQRAKTNSKR